MASQEPLRETYPIFTKGDKVQTFFSNAKRPWNAFSNLYTTPVTYAGDEYPSVEHAFHAQKFLDKTPFTTRGVFGDPTNNFERGWTAYFAAKTPKGKNAEKVAQQLTSRHRREKKNTMGVLARMVNTLSKDPNLRDRLGLVLDPAWTFHASHETLWLELIRSKFEAPALRELLMSTGDTYLIEYQKVATVNGEEWIHFYSAYYDSATGECKHANNPRSNAIGKFLMKTREHQRKRKADLL